MPEVELDQQGSNRVQLLTHPVALPGHCSICGYSGGEDRKFIDFDLTIDFYGAVIFCSECVVNMANVLGYVTPEMYDDLANRFGALIIENNKLGLENDRLSNALGSMLTGRDSYSNRALVAQSQERAGEQPVSIGSASSDESESGSNDSGTKKSVAKPRPASVRASSSDESAHESITI